MRRQYLCRAGFDPDPVPDPVPESRRSGTRSDICGRDTRTTMALRLRNAARECQAHNIVRGGHCWSQAPILPLIINKQALRHS